MNLSRRNIMIRALALALFALVNFISFKTFSAEIPACELASEGYVQNQWKNIRIQVNNAIVAGAETLSDLANQMEALVSEQKCLPSPVSCALAAEGSVVGAWAKHRIIVGQATAFGANTTARVLAQLGQLQQMGICQ